MADLKETIEMDSCRLIGYTCFQRIDCKMMVLRWWWIFLVSLLTTVALHLSDLPSKLRPFLSNFYRDIKVALPVFQVLIEALTAMGILILLAFLIFSVVLLFSSLRPWRRMRETVIHFVDLRESAAQKK